MQSGQQKQKSNHFNHHALILFCKFQVCIGPIHENNNIKKKNLHPKRPDTVCLFQLCFKPVKGSCHYKVALVVTCTCKWNRFAVSHCATLLYVFCWQLTSAMINLLHSYRNCAMQMKAFSVLFQCNSFRFSVMHVDCLSAVKQSAQLACETIVWQAVSSLTS